MLEVRDVSKFYGDFEALCGVGFSAGRGSCIGLVGPNGAGKSSLCRVLAGVFLPDGGDVRLGGVSVFSSVDYRLRVGYLPEETAMPGDWCVRDFVEWAAFLRTRGRGSVSVDYAFERLGLSEVAGRVIASLSRGYRQRVGLAAAIVGEPELLVLDEPATGLDPVQQIEFRELVSELSRDRVVVMSSHVLGEVERVCSSVLLIDRGSVVASVARGELEGQVDRRRFKIVVAEGSGSFVPPGGVELVSERVFERAGVACRELVFEGAAELSGLVGQAALCGLRVLSAEEESAGLEALFMRIREERGDA